ncbi:endolytic transglycosylase MltG [Ectothiorhodospiraceae bacterium WFHF3C12]|nr:endolytic transglycosylase MltG [Ectothiorhodospiraceae bacterium WFHF3C12]
MKRRLLIGAILILVALAGALGSLAYSYQVFTRTALVPVDGEPRTFHVEPGSSFQGVARALARQGFIERALLYRLMARLQGKAQRIKAGEYAIEPGMSPQAFLDRMVSGDVVQYSLTLVEGWNFHEMMVAVRAHEALEHTLESVSAEAVMAAIGEPDQHPEGRFYPDTYHFPRGTTDVAFLERAYQRMSARLAEIWAERDEGLPLESAYEALILASIIEKETAVPEERRRIAGVFARRLERGMRLQTDPTVIYGIGPDFDGNITRSDLRTDTPYNTYTRGGLPPTPIAMPGGASIEAAVHPAEGDALYFVSKGDGSHHFSATLREHNQAVRRFQLNR